MPRCLLTVGMAIWAVTLMGADFKATQLQREMADLLHKTIGLERSPNGEPGWEYSFQVTPQAVQALENFKESGNPVVIANTDELASKKSEVLQVLGFIPRVAAPTDQEVFKLDVTDVTIKTLKGKTVTILSDGTVKFRTTK